MLADHHACSPRNPYPGSSAFLCCILVYGLGTLYHTSDLADNVYGDQVVVDYRGYEGMPQVNFLSSPIDLQLIQKTSFEY